VGQSVTDTAVARGMVCFGGFRGTASGLRAIDRVCTETQSLPVMFVLDEVANTALISLPNVVSGSPECEACGCRCALSGASNRFRIR
jgi:hypothetical protein